MLRALCWPKAAPAPTSQDRTPGALLRAGFQLRHICTQEGAPRSGGPLTPRPLSRSAAAWQFVL